MKAWCTVALVKDLFVRGLEEAVGHLVPEMIDQNYLPVQSGRIARSELTVIPTQGAIKDSFPRKPK